MWQALVRVGREIRIETGPLRKDATIDSQLLRFVEQSVQQGGLDSGGRSDVGHGKGGELNAASIAADPIYAVPSRLLPGAA